ncbi:hypothetical protein [Pedobacter deserti]|uniref:hypothetical protein n=1 Tax=Pedobacter deserti TaxID=2817382 RepID=UPI00210BC485|nr:hypothetical protein [Pedobacter sp. SYSU D00382]
MSTVYQPFRSFDFHYKKCYLSGDTFSTPIEESNILPRWLLDMAGLSGEEPIKLLDESIRSYNSLKVPVNIEVQEHFVDALEQRMQQAFSEGYQGVSQLVQADIFNWIGKFLYGLVYLEMNAAVRQQQLSADGLNMSQGLMHKFGNLHTMIQGIYTPVEFEEFQPWSIVVVELAEDTPFSFRDEINTLTFSMKMKNFGIVACLQDNGTNARFHQQLLDQIKGTKLSAEQFEELCARFYYSAYLFNRLPEYAVMPVEGTIYIEPMPLKGTLNKPIFDHWQHKTYAQVLQEFWKPWGHTLFEIIKDPANPMSYFHPPALPAVL